MLLQPAAFAKQLQPYKTLSEPAGAVLLRGGRVPQRTLLKLLQPHQQDLAGVLWGQLPMPTSPSAHLTYTHLNACFPSASPQLLLTTWGRLHPREWVNSARLTTVSKSVLKADPSVSIADPSVLTADMTVLTADPSVLKVGGCGVVEVTAHMSAAVTV
ncbi:uncharacterized protein HaLaN_28077 [Haematococcus lacustris]|uniref:Uncharacterized protein n=1 Tax=Haematococcus lacustris TaxID=44745 RepID=A0A6A0AC10_HAELA|nr:uncharacterized protein HaLaN_28077 [Haematococcus lacustris]